MPLDSDLASNIVNDLQNAANEAKQRALSAPLLDLSDVKYPDFHIPPLARNKAALNKQLRERWAANLIRDSIDACANVLAGTVFLAADEHAKGIDLIERGIKYRSKNVFEKYPDNMWNPIKETLDTLERNDLSALREHTKVESGLYARVYAGIVWESCASRYVDEILAVYGQVKYDIATYLED